MVEPIYAFRNEVMGMMADCVEHPLCEGCSPLTLAVHAVKNAIVGMGQQAQLRYLMQEAAIAIDPEADVPPAIAIDREVANSEMVRTCNAVRAIRDGLAVCPGKPTDGTPCGLDERARFRAFAKSPPPLYTSQGTRIDLTEQDWHS